MATDTTAVSLHRATCPDCGESVASLDVEWVERAMALHRCQTPEMARAAQRITMALQGLYDG